jgi:hypothetical protein
MKIQLSLAAALLLVCSVAFGQDKKPSPEDAAMMEAMMKAGTPGDAHKALEPFVGTWSTKVTSWMKPGADPMVMEGTAESRWVMGGRYIEERFKGDFMGMPFEGLGFTGYDNVKKQYWSTWMDNMSTGIMSSTGARDGKVWTYNGTMADPMTGKDSALSMKLNVADADKHTMEMWAPAPDGKNYKMMEIVYARKK